MQGEDEFVLVEITIAVTSVFGLKMTVLVGKKWNNGLGMKLDSLDMAVSFLHMNRTYISHQVHYKNKQNFFLRSGLLFALEQFSAIF